MKFLVDANLPFKLTLSLREIGFDVLHTDDLPDKERTTDREIRRISKKENRVVITKDSDFLDSHIIQGIPQQLLYIATGNIVNKVLLELIEKSIDSIIELFEIYDFIELNNEAIIGHDK